MVYNLELIRKIPMRYRVLFLPLFLLFFPGVLHAQSEEEALRLNQQGMEAYQHGKYQEALPYFERSLEMHQRLNIPRGISVNLNNIGSVYGSLEQYDKALSYHEQSLNISRELNIPQDIAISLNNIGGVYSSFRQYYKALPYHEDALKYIKTSTSLWI